MLCQHSLVELVEVSFLSGKASSFRAVVRVVGAKPRIEFYICLTRYRRQLVAFARITLAEHFGQLYCVRQFMEQGCQQPGVCLNRRVLLEVANEDHARLGSSGGF